MTSDHLSHEKQKIGLGKNAQLCLNFGYGTLITARNNMDYRNAVISIHNGCELLMKHNLHLKDKLLIYRNVTPKLIIHTNCSDKVLEEVRIKREEKGTVSFLECTVRLIHFSKAVTKYHSDLGHLNRLRNHMVHYEFTYRKKVVWVLLIAKTFQFISDLIIEMGLELTDFLKGNYIQAIEKFKKSIDDIKLTSYTSSLEIANRHYFEDLSEEERHQKIATVEYTRKQYDEIVDCPACNNKALLERRPKVELLLTPFRRRKRSIILERLTCHHCALSISDYDQLKIDFGDHEEISIKSLHYPSVYPDDCPPEDGPDYDCPDYDCPEDGPEDCPPEDDCPDYDCPDNGPEDCPDNS